MQTAPSSHRAVLLTGWRWEMAFGFVYWLGFVLVLEPGNVLRAIQDGAPLPPGPEVARLLGAGVLGAAVTPLVFALTWRFAVEGEARWRHAAFHAACDLGLAAAMIVVAGILASFGLDRRPLLAALREQLAVDGLLLFFCLVALTGIAHAILFVRRAQNATHLPPAAAQETAGLTSIPVRARGHVELLDLAEVDWIETQGNYLALHAGDAVHLIRETSLRLEARLDPARFVRIHRQTIVALDRVMRLAPLANGDATLRLKDGTELRMSRNYGDKVRAKFGP